MQQCDGRCKKPSRHKYTMSYDTQAARFEALEERLQRIELLLGLLVRDVAPEYAEVLDESKITTQH